MAKKDAFSKLMFNLAGKLNDKPPDEKYPYEMSLNETNDKLRHDESQLDPEVQNVYVDDPMSQSKSRKSNKSRSK